MEQENNNVLGLKNELKKYVSMGWPAFPVIGKFPPMGLSWGEYQDRLPTDSEIESWFENYHGITGIAGAMGKIIGATVIDADIKNPEKRVDPEILKRLKQEGYPETQTGSLGSQFMVAYDESLGFTSNSDVLPGIDIKSQKGYVILPPSTALYRQDELKYQHFNGNKYKWIREYKPGEVLKPFPVWLLDLIKQNKKGSTNRKWKEKIVSPIEEGSRNCDFASIIGGLLSKFTLQEEWDKIVWPMVANQNKAQEKPLSENELLSIFKSITKSELQKRENAKSNYNLPLRLQGYEIDASKFNNIRIKKDDFEYEVSAIEEIKEGMKATIMLSQSGQRLNKSRISLSSGHTRKIFAKECTKGKKNEITDKINDQLIDIEEIITAIITAISISKKAEAEDKEKESMLTEAEAIEAEEILKSPTLLYNIRQLFPRLMIAGDVKNCLLIYLSGTSRILDSPISLTGKGESSIGKSYPVQKIILRLFYREAYEDISEATKMSFYHAAKDAFKHKIMVLFEKPGTDQTDYSIRTMQSEKKLKLQVTVKDPETGEFRTEIKEVDGPVAFITTTTSPNIHPENETRCFSWYGDDSEEQTLNTFEMTDAKYRGIEEISDEELKKYKNIQRVIKQYPVLIPYAQDIRKKFPLKPIRVRRDYGRLLAFIETVTVLHQYQRTKKVINGKEYLVATIADYHIAKTIAEDVLKQIIFELPPKTERLIKTAEEILLEKELEGSKDISFSIRELAQKSGDNYDTAGKWFKPAFERGRFKIKDQAKGSIGAKYILGDRKAANITIIPATEDLAKLYPEHLGEIYDPITGETIQYNNNSTDVPMPDKSI